MPEQPLEPAGQDLQAEIDQLRNKLDRRGDWARRRLRLRRIGAGVLVVLFAVAAVSATIGTWARTTLLDTDEFVDTVAPVARDHEVDAALAAFLTTELFIAFDVEQLAEDALPDDEDHGVVAAFRRSAHLVRGHFWLVFVLVTLPVLVEEEVLHIVEYLVHGEPALGVFAANAIVGSVVGSSVGLTQVTLAHRLAVFAPMATGSS